MLSQTTSSIVIHDGPRLAVLMQVKLPLKTIENFAYLTEILPVRALHGQALYVLLLSMKMQPHRKIKHTMDPLLTNINSVN